MDTRIRDQLAHPRTELADKRTLPAYIRTALGFVIVGVLAVWWMDYPYLQALGGLSLVVGVGCVGIGIQRFMAARRFIA
ncbi:MAG: DUF202 domain-containing protein [Nitrospira sp.]|nr:DUF202 domain-containing protein [Nitrospira sp.]